MAQDVVEQLEGFVSEDPTTWGRLSGDVPFRRLQLLALREILIELRRIREMQAGSEVHATRARPGKS